LVDGDPKDVRQAYATWWQYLTSALDVRKDVDGLHPESLRAIEQGTWIDQGTVMPATAVAVLDILTVAQPQIAPGKIVNYRIIGRSDLLGLPLYYELKNQGKNVELLGKNDLTARLEDGRALLEADVIIAATGVRHVVTGEMVKDGVVVIDVGEPQPDVEMATVAAKASFITPVPGGVGPLTVVSLLQNSLQLAQRG
jgi:methylenetetrahydrofolate dehydrogenase (NADP+)/methenyltetrahydrofolate cyclohydrolase